MKKKSFLLLAVSLLLIGCNGNKKKSSSSDLISSSSAVESSEIISSEEDSSEEISSLEESSEEESSEELSSEEESEESSESETFSSEELSSSEAEEGYGYNYYDGYYGELTWDNGDDLKQKLHDIIRTGYTALKYNWENNTDADHSYYDFEMMDVVYSPDDIPAPLTQKKWQREHVFAASLMTGELTKDATKTPGRATDYHNLIAGDSTGNNSRSNKNFGVADKTAESYQNRTVNNGYDGYSFDSTVFEPGNKDKGRLARAIFYMGTMYKDDEGNYKGLKLVEENVPYSSGNCQFAIGHLSTLLNWSNTYSVDYLEMQHNESVYSHVFTETNKAQGNRNPFVDYPDLVDYVYGSKQNEAGDLKDLKPACYDLGSNTNEFSHYALGTAQRSFNYGDTLTADKFAVYKVNKNYTYTTASANEYTHSLLNHQFVKEDGGSLDATITAGDDTIKYQIELDPMAGCSFYADNIKNTGIDKTKPNVDHNVTYGSKNFTFNFVASGSVTMTNTSAGGFKIGSGNVAVTKITITYLTETTIDEIYFNGYAANKDSSYQLSIKVGSTEVYKGTVVNSSVGQTYGAELNEPITGIVTYTFTGSNALNLCGLAFNEVSL